METYGDRLFLSSSSGRRNLVVFDQWLNELAWTSTRAICKRGPIPLGGRLLARLDGDDLFWIDTPDGRLVPTGVRIADRIPDLFLVYVSQDELAYFKMFPDSLRSDAQTDRVEVRRLDRDLRETSVQFCVPPSAHHELVVLGGRMVMVFRRSVASVGTIDLLVVDPLLRSHVDVPMPVQREALNLTSHEGRLFVPLMSEDQQLVVYCFNRDAAQLWHACLPLTGNLRPSCIVLIPDGRPAALVWHAEDNVKQPLVLDR
eukprot:TRINITY_DN1033_c0_g1_i1.p1 TRINITY_DN1033_c0_g1~~TRINITY_DN1033_c0_g1_i1.p1  ORF type:complete len:258 (-),score=31.47 TRINITY_DN1033_c0_g1_i1:804-1577(-)